MHVSACPAAPTVLKWPAVQRETRLDEASAQVYVASAPSAADVAAFVTVGQAWHTVSAVAVHAVCTYVPSAHEAAHAVQESGVPAPPTVLKYPAAHADTRLSLAEAQVYVAPVAALSTVGQVVHAPESR